MDKNIESIELSNHKVNISDRKNILLSGIKKINSFNDTEFFVESIMGPIIIKGSNLELVKLDTFKGDLSIKGKINSLMYFEDNKKMKVDTILSRLFK